MAPRKLARSYARAIVDIAVEQNSLDRVRGEIRSFSNQMERSDELTTALTNPTVALPERKGIVRELAIRLALSKVTTNFLFLLSDKRRIGILPAIANAVDQFADTREGTVRAHVVSRDKLSDVQLQRLKTALGKMTGKQVEIETEVDASVIGGLAVNLRGKIYDGTVKTALETLRQEVVSGTRPHS